MRLCQIQRMFAICLLSLFLFSGCALFRAVGVQGTPENTAAHHMAESAQSSGNPIIMLVGLAGNVILSLVEKKQAKKA